MNAVEDGYYTLRSMSDINTIGYIYMNNFNLFNLSENLLSENDDSCGEGQFRLITHLLANTTYVLVVTTSSPNVTGAFSILASGPSTVTLNHMGE